MRWAHSVWHRRLQCARMKKGVFLLNAMAESGVGIVWAETIRGIRVKQPRNVGGGCAEAFNPNGCMLGGG